MSSEVAQELTTVVEGQVVCEVGRGTDNVIHRHWRVDGITKLYIKHRLGNHKDDPVSRFRRDDGRSVPYSEYGGSTIHTTCQRPRKKAPPGKVVK